MRRCLLSDAGVNEYYLDPIDTTKKVGGAVADITSGDDGQVMDEIPAFYYKYGYAGTTHSYGLSQTPRNGYSVHPAFMKNGEFVPYRYIGAYEGSMYDASAGAMVAPADIVNNMYAAGDKLCSLSGQFPKTNETRAEFRAMAANRGTGWRQQDYDLVSAIQLLCPTEYADFNSQLMIGPGRTQLSGGSWVYDSYIGQCGKSNGDGNGTNSVGGNDNAAYMTYRGIENFYGNIWKWLDGINIGGAAPADDYKVHVCNDDTHFADDTWTDYFELDGILPALAGGGFQATLHPQPRGFIPATVGATSMTKITDALWTNSGWRVVTLGGYAHGAEYAGAFCVRAHYGSAYAAAAIGGRLAY